MDSTNTVCPVCTLFLRPGITLKQHLSSHPKQKVIEALVKLAGVEDIQKESSTPSQSEVLASNSQVNAAVLNQPWNPPLSGHLGTNSSGQLGTNPSGQLGTNSSVQPIPGNHVFIYQQSMSTTSPQANVLNVNPLSQQYVYPTVFNPQMMPYVYQQQQVIMSSNSLPPNIRALPFELPGTSQTNNAETTVQTTMETEALANDTIIKSNENNNNVEEEISIEEEEIKTKGTHQNSESEVKKHEIVTLVEKVKTMEDFEMQQENFNDIPPEVFPGESEEEFDHDYEEPASSPTPQNSSDWRFNSELNKACQTQNTNSTPPRPQVVEEEEGMIQNSQYTEEDSPEDQPDYFYVEQPVHQYPEQSNCYSKTTNVPFTTVKINESYEQSEPIYTSANILHGGDHLDFVNMDDIVIIGDFSTNQMISQVDNFENTSPDRNGVLMTIGDIEQSKNDFNDQRDLEESMSRSSSHVNIRSDERMPARGELSGQESIGGASDITWNRLQYQEGSSRMSHSYDLIGRDSWDVSDSNSGDTPNVPKRDSAELYQENYVDNELDTPTVVSYTGPPLNFKCATCGESFANSKERKEHELEKHPEKSKKSSIGSEIGKKKVKKLVVKMKSDKPEGEKNFDNVFTNKLKIETSVENELIFTEQTKIKVDETPTAVTLDAKSTIKPSVKTVCSICDCVLENTKALKEHKIEVHNETYRLKNKCSTCNESFTNEYKFTEHLKVHPLECRLCGKLFYRRQNIQLHMKRHLGLKPYKCDICQKCFVTRQKHDEHRNVHTGDTPIKCNMCDEKFRRHSNLVQHRNRHHFQIKKKIKDYICQCGEIFHSKKKLAWHKEIHEAKPKACTQCSEKFLHMSSLTRHMRRAHNQQFLPEEKRKNENVECPICKGTYLRSSLEVHIRNHSGQRPYTCLICNKDFTTKWNLKLHKWTHASRTSKPFKCDQCKGAFIRESDYVAHMNSHKSVRPYTCNYCGAQFIRKYNCLRHVKEHENNKNFSCGVCGKTFHRSYYLKDHMRVHSGVRPYTCHICGKTSTTKSNHNKHVQIHHAREPVSTEN